MRDHILVVAGDGSASQSCLPGLVARCGYYVRVRTARDAVDSVLLELPAVVIVDIPGEQAAAILRELRTATSTPIAAVVSAAGEQTSVEALDAGADTVLLPPISRRVLAARLTALLRFRPAERPVHGARERYIVGSLVIDVGAHRAAFEGRPLKLTPIEFRLLSTLARRPGCLVSYNDLSGAVWGDGEGPRPSSVRQYVNCVRRKLRELSDDRELIRSRRGAGVALAVPTVASGKGVQHA